MLVRDFNSKLESFGCTKRNTSGPMLQNIQNELNLIYLNNDEHTHMDRAKGSTDTLDMMFIKPNLAKHDIQFQTLIKLVKFLKRGKAPGPDNIHNEVLRLGTTTSLYHHLARLFTSSI